MSFPLMSRLCTSLSLFFLISIPTSIFAQFSNKRILAACGDCQPSTQKMADLDNDGDQDLLVYFRPDIGNDRRIEWYENDGKGNFLTPALLLEPDHSPYEFYPNDIDNDGDIDIFITNAGVFIFYENLGDNTFAEVVDISESTSGTNLVIEDINQDGHKDLVLPYNIFLHDGNLNFILFEPIVELRNLDHKVVDWDNDGDMDIIGSEIQRRISLFENNNNQFFEEPVELIWLPDNNSYARSMSVKDADMDGDVDILIGEYVYDVSYYENLGNGQVGERIELNAGGLGYPTVDLLDIDKDGDLDPVFSSEGGIYWVEHFGSGDFGPRKTIFESEDDAAVITPSDIDQDGDLDLISNSYENGIVMLRRNLHNAACISGKVFVDENLNGNFETNEEILDHRVLNVTPSPVGVEITSDGVFKYYFDKGNYTIELDESECWSSTSGQNSITISVDTADVFNIDFPVERNSETVELTTTLTSGPTRCGFTVPFYLNTQNTGCKKTNGMAYFVLDELVTYISADPAPTYTVLDTLFWTFDDLEVDDFHRVNLEFQIAGVDFLGEIIEMPAGAIALDDSNQMQGMDHFDFISEINCSYDPNDKQTAPARGGRNYTLMDEELLYTIRFKNTGTDTAFNIEIRDEISPLLDANSIRVINSTHPMTSEYNFYTNILHFNFDNILLPDSTTNLEASQGQLSFAITPFDGFAEKTAVFNEAEIYFDFNPPIVTNEVVNTFVSEFNCIDSIGPNGEDILPMEIDYTIDYCAGDANANVFIFASDGIPSYSYNNSPFDSTITVLIQDPSEVAEFYFEDAGNCVEEFSLVIEETVTPIQVVSTAINIDCFDNEFGRIETTATGGTPPYAYLWSNNETTPNLENLEAGNYGLTITDSNECTVEIMYTIFQPDYPLLNPMVQELSCYESNDGALGFGNNDCIDCSFVWSNGSTEADISGLAAGYYEVEITDVNTGCVFNFDFELEEPPAILSATITSPEIDENMNGTASVNVTGGTPPYSYQWSHDDTENTNNVEGLSSGEYLVTVTDSDDCLHIVTVLIDQMVDVDELADELLFTVSPNPSSGHLFVDVDLKNNQDWELKIFNSVGQLVNVFSRNNTGEQLEMELSEGLYFFSLSLDGTIVNSKKVIVTN